MKIETLDDWVTVGCCCPMPACPDPGRECESIGGWGQVGFYIYNGAEKTYYGTKRTDYEDGGFRQRTAPSIHWTQLGGKWIEPHFVEYTEGDPQTGEITETYSDVVSVEDSRVASFAAMVDALDWETMSKGTVCTSGYKEHSPYGWFPAYHLSATFVRFRWVIPDDFEGKRFKITWDVYEELDDGEPSFYAQDQTWNWTGPGDPQDPDSWKSDWYEIPPPSVEGRRRVVNIRFECYTSSKFGNKPQSSGEAIEL